MTAVNSSFEKWQEEPFLLRRRPEDATLARDVRAMLAGTLGSEARNLVVLVEDGTVTLAGRVSERWMQLEIAHEALHLEGVRGVVSHVSSPKHAAK